MDSSSQTDAPGGANSSTAFTQTVTKVDKGVSVEIINDDVGLTSLSSSALSGLSEASSRMLSELQSNDRSFALRGYFGFDNNNENSSGASSILSSVAIAFEQPEDSESRIRGAQGSSLSMPAFPCSSVSWNATGLLLAVAYGMNRHQHGGWCNHRAGVAILSSSTSSSSSLNKPNNATGIEKWTPEMILDTESCVTALAFHPREPSIVAAGTFSGELIVWDVQRGLRAEDNESGGSSNPSNDSNLDPLLYKTRIDDFLHREAVCGLSWVKDPSLSDEYMLVSVSCEGRMLLWSLKNKLIHPISCSQIAVESSVLKRDKGGRGGKVDDGSDDEDERMRRGASKRVDSSSTLRSIGVSTMCALPETSGFPCIVGGESGFLMKCEISVSSSALAASAHKEGSPWRPEHKIGSLNRAENSLPWEQAAAEILMRASETDRARICRSVEKWTREVGAKTVTLPLFLSSRPEAPLGVIFTNPVKSQLTPHVGPINSVALHPSRRNVLLSAGADGRVCVYSTLQSKPLLELDAAVAAVSAEGGDAISKGVIGLTSCSWSAANPLVFAVGSTDGGVSVFDLFNSTCLPSLVLRGESSVGLSAQNLNTVELYNSSSISRSTSTTRGSRSESRIGMYTSIASPVAGSITSVSFNPRMHEKKRMLLAVGDSAGSVRLWQLPWRLAGDEVQSRAALETWLGTD